MDNQTIAQEIGLTRTEARSIATLACEASESGDLETARAMLETLSLINPKDSAIANALGTVYLKLDLNEKAEAAFSLAIESEGNSFAMVYRGELRLRAGDERGLDDLRAVVAFDPKAATPPGERAQQVLAARQQIRK